MTDAVSRDDANKIFQSLGDLQGQLRQLTASVIEGREESQREHRKVHDIVDAQSESIRNLARSVDEMKPHVEGLRLKGMQIDEAIKLSKELHEERLEKRGADKSADRMRAMLYGFCVAVGGIAGGVINWVFGARPHP